MKSYERINFRINELYSEISKLREELKSDWDIDVQYALEYREIELETLLWVTNQESYLLD